MLTETTTKRDRNYLPEEASVREDAPLHASESGGLFYDDEGVVHELAEPTIAPPLKTPEP